MAVPNPRDDSCDVPVSMSIHRSPAKVQRNSRPDCQRCGVRVPEYAEETWQLPAMRVSSSVVRELESGRVVRNGKQETTLKNVAHEQRALKFFCRLSSSGGVTPQDHIPLALESMIR